jgi:hypothetical protein
MQKQMIAHTLRTPAKFWVERREASLNWLAVGLLLAAWNAADNGTEDVRRRPDSLRGYSTVSPRAAARNAALMR